MRRSEAVAALAVSVGLVVAGLTWLFGPFGLIGTGAALGVVALFTIDVKE